MVTTRKDICADGELAKTTALCDHGPVYVYGGRVAAGEAPKTEYVRPEPPGCRPDTWLGGLDGKATAGMSREKLDELKAEWDEKERARIAGIARCNR